MTMWFKRHNEYGCPMCGRNPKVKETRTQQLEQGRKLYLYIYRLQCPREHFSTSWFANPDYAARQWKQLVNEYRKDTK